MANKEASPGPYKSTTTRTIKLAPIEFTSTEVIDSTHVPPPDCPCAGASNGGAALEALLQLVQQYAASRAASSPDPSGMPTDTDAPTS